MCAHTPQELPNKDADEVRRYHEVFWARYQSLADWPKLIAAIERGEARRSKMGAAREAIAAKVRIVMAHAVPPLA